MPARDVGDFARAGARQSIIDARGRGIYMSHDTCAISALSANKAEGNSGTTPFTFTVTRSGDTSGVSTTVNYAVDDFFGADQTTTLDGTNTGIFRARALDFDGGVLPSGTVTFDAGETSKTITILVARRHLFRDQPGKLHGAAVQRQRRRADRDRDRNRNHPERRCNLQHRFRSLRQRSLTLWESWTDVDHHWADADAGSRAGY